jgi:tetrahydromethanopterin S-methyltransferase subunit G
MKQYILERKKKIEKELDCHWNDMSQRLKKKVTFR